MSLNNIQTQLKAAAFCVSVVGYLTGCSSDSISEPSALEDPAEAVIIDTAISGNFDGDSVDVLDDILPEENVEIIFTDLDTNTLSDADIARAPDFTYEALVLAFETVTVEFPEVDTSSDAFAIALIDRLILDTRIGGRNTRGIFDQFNNLTDAEKNLVLRNPVKGVRTKLAADSAVATTQSLFTGSLFLTRGDAFRHAYWNWLMSDCCTVQWATAFATAHESETPNNDDKRMDLNNNIIGRRIYSAAPTASAATAQASILDYRLLWVNSTTKNVTVGIDYLVYLEPMQVIRVFDDGPDFDDIFTISIDGNTLGNTPLGGARDFNFDLLPSGDHSLDILCRVDGTMGGCGFQIDISGALTLSNGMQQTPQIGTEQGETYPETLTFPTMNMAREN